MATNPSRPDVPSLKSVETEIDRRSSKLSISDAAIETFDASDLVTDKEVRIDAWIYAASVEDGNDYHLILGHAPDAAGTPVYTTVELSALPPANEKSRVAIEEARADLEKFFSRHFAGTLPGTSFDFYDPPIELQIESSRDDKPAVWEARPITLGQRAGDAATRVSSIRSASNIRRMSR
jgi:hypothetical protein